MSTIVKNNNTSNKMRIKLDENIFEEVQISYIKSGGRQEEGIDTHAIGQCSHAEGNSTDAIGDNSHTEGSHTLAQGTDSHAEGATTQALGDYSHAEGRAYTTASGVASHAEGSGTIAAGNEQHAQGRYNIQDTENQYAHIVGNGQLDEEKDVINRSNAHTLDWYGNAWFAGDITGYNIKADGTQIEHKLSNKVNQSDFDAIKINAGDYKTPIYFNHGIPTALNYTIEKSVPSDANFNDTTYSVATTTTAGLMSADDKTKLNGIATGANKYSLPVATASTLGGVKIGSNISIASDGVISAKDTTYSAGAGLNLDTTTFSINNQYSFRQLGWNVDDYNNANDAGVIGFWTQSERTTDGNGTPTGISKLPESMWYNLIQFRGNSETKVCFAAQVTSTNDVNPKLYFKTHYHEATGPWMELTSRVYVDSGAKDTYVVFSDIKEDVGLSFRPAHVDGQQIKPYLGTSSYLWAGAYLNNSNVVTSDLNKKKNLEKLSNDNRYIQLFDKIEPYRYKMKNGKSDRYHTGFISQYVESALKECNLTDLDCAFFCKDLNKTKTEETGEPVYDYSLRYEEYIAIMAAKIKSLEKRIQELEKK